jgi:predicted phosphodiesterase
MRQQKIWTKEEIEYLKSNFSQKLNADLEKELNRSYESIHGKAKGLGLKKDLDYIYPKAAPKLENKKVRFNMNNINLISDLKEQLRTIPGSSIKTNNKLNKSGDTLVVHFTDWHVGRLVKNEDGVEIYNTDIFKERVNKLLQEILVLLELYIKKGTPVTDVVILSTGDILDGAGIFASQETQSELSPPRQVMLAVSILVNFITALINRGLTVKFYGVRGNHGEIRGEKGKAKDPEANWDTQLYLILDFWAKTIKSNKIEIYYSELDYLNFAIRGWKYHIRHIAPQQTDTPSGKAKFLGWAKQHKCEVIVYGHFHHAAISDRSGITVIRGGSMTGADEYSEQLAEEADPIQVIWGCSKNRPVTFIYLVDLGKRKNI